MKKEVKLIKKVKRLLKRLGCSTYRHHFGPKTYKFYVHIAALLVRCYCRLSYRRTAYFMDLIGLECPSKSALQYTASRISSNFWNKMLELTSGIRHKIVALDATGFSRTNPSYHYLNRIKGTMPKVYVKLNAGLSVVNRKFCAAKIKILPSHEVKEAINLLKKTKVEIVVADKGYDANYIHEFCVSRNIEAHIPMVNHGKAKHNMMSERRLAEPKTLMKIFIIKEN